MKILLAAGIFFPDVGGPAIHVQKIAERLQKEGYDITVVAYGERTGSNPYNFKVKRISRRYPSYIRWFLYLITILRESFNSSLIYAFDPTAAGVPALICAKLLSKKFIIRIGGDPIWEREAEFGRRLMPITVYYEKGFHLIDKPYLYKVIRWLLNSSDNIVIYNSFWRDFFGKYFGVDHIKFTIIKNPAFKRENGDENLSLNPAILFAGRFVAYKNLPLVIDAFQNLKSSHSTLKLVLIGTGPEVDNLKLKASKSHYSSDILFINPLSQPELFEMIKKASISIGPALSEFNPNFILESLSFGKPVIISKGHGLSVDLDSEFLFDPLDQSDLEKKIDHLLNRENYRKAVQKINEMNLNYGWDDVTSAHLKLIRENLK